MQSQASHPIIMAFERMQQLSCLANEKLYQLVSARWQQESLIIIANAVCSLLAQLLQSIHFGLWSEFIF